MTRQPYTAPPHLVSICGRSQTPQIRALRAERLVAIIEATRAGYGAAELARAFGLSKPTMQHIIRRQRRLGVDVDPPEVEPVTEAPQPRQGVRKAIIGTGLHTASVASDPRSVAVSLPREPWEARERRISLPGDRPSAGVYRDDVMPAGAARVSLVKRWLREAVDLDLDLEDTPREVVL